MRRLVIVGAGGHGRELLDVVEAVNRIEPTFEVLGFVADEADRPRLARRQAKLLGPVDALEDLDAEYALGIGNPSVRAELDERFTAWGKTAATLIHPSATAGSDLRLADGVVLFPGARLTTNIDVGRHVHLNVNAVVSHDCEIGDHATLSPGVLVNGDVRLGARVFLGTGSVVMRGRSVGQDALVGAGAVVTRDVPPRATARGVPARWERP